MDELEDQLNVQSEPMISAEPPHSPHSMEWRRFFRMHPALKRALPTIGISMLSTLVVLVIGAGVVWAFRAPIARGILASAPQTSQLAALETQSQAASPVAAGGITTAQAQPHDLSVTDVVAKANPSVVSIEVSQSVSQSNSPLDQFFPGFFDTPSQSAPQSQVVGGGSGFFVTSDGLIVTNRHVVDFTNATFTVITSSGKKYPATVIAKDPVLDIAMIRVQGSGFTAATLGDSDQLVLGQSVVAIGYALGEFKNSISTGVVSGLARSIVAGGEGGEEDLDNVIQTSAAINPGNSGGPLLNLQGNVIGVDVAMAQGSQNVGFALPINSVRSAIESVEKTGTIIRPYVGLQYAQIDSKAQAQLNLPFDYGILVQQVIAGSPAAVAGLRQGDIVLSVDGVKLDSDNSFATVIRNKTVGQTVSLQVYTSGTQKTFRVTLVQAPAS